MEQFTYLVKKLQLFTHLIKNLQLFKHLIEQSYTFLVYRREICTAILVWSRSFLYGYCCVCMYVCMDVNVLPMIEYNPTLSSLNDAKPS